MSKDKYLLILKLGSYLGLFSVFMFFRNFLFPYITSKQIFFNIVMELLFAFWLVVILRYPETLPFGAKDKKSKPSLITVALFSYFAVIIISSFTGVDFNLSFWGDIERMLGAFHLLHFLFFYLVLIVAFREWKEWKTLFTTSLAASAVISIKGLAGEAFSLLGNTSYVSAYLIFNFYFSILLFFKEENKFWRWAYFLPWPLMFLAFKKANTSGAMVGLGSSLILFTFLFGALNKNRKIRYSSLAVAIVSLAMVVFVFTHKDNPLVSRYKFIQDISFKKNTFQTRLISWKAAYKDFHNHPWLGTGYGNYATIFDKHFEPKFYSFTRTETYFDRAHNNLIEIGSTTGSLGLLSYLSIFVALLYYLIKTYRSGRIGVKEFVTIFSLIFAYFVQNLALFDALVTYISLMMVLAYVYWLDRSQPILPEDKIEVKPIIVPEGEKIIFAVGAVIALLLIYNYNYKVIVMLDKTIDGQIAFRQNNDFFKAEEVYKDALSQNTILDRDSRNSFIDLAKMGLNPSANIDKKKANEAFDYVLSLAQKNLDYNPKDVIMNLQVAQVYDLRARFNSSDKEKFSEYTNQAMKYIDIAIANSPGRADLYLLKARFQITRGQVKEAVATTQYALDLNPHYPESSCQLARIHLLLPEFSDKEKEAFEYLNACLDDGGFQVAPFGGVLPKITGHYAENKDLNRLILVYEAISRSDEYSQNPSAWINLAKLYKENGNKEKAKTAAQKAAEVDKSLESSVDKFINSLQ